MTWDWNGSLAASPSILRPAALPALAALLAFGRVVLRGCRVILIRHHFCRYKHNGNLEALRPSQ
jgi:hypothetical protein